MISGLQSGAGVISPFTRGQTDGPPRPDFGKLDADRSGGMSIDELKSGLSSGAFGKVGESQQGRPTGGGEANGNRPPPPPPPGNGPPPGGGQAGQSGGPPRSEGTSIAALLLESAITLLSENGESDDAVADLFSAMDTDGDDSISAAEFGDFGDAMRPGGQQAFGGQGFDASAYGVTLSLGADTDLTSLAALATSLRA